jgi:hypothetical protein
MKFLANLVTLLALALPVLGQAPGAGAQLPEKDMPTTILLKDLTSEWRRIAVSAPEGPLGGMADMMKNFLPMALMGAAGKPGSKDDLMGMAMVSSMFGGGRKGEVYYSRGQTSTIGGETFLIAYRFEPPQVDFMKLILESQANGGKEPDFARFAADSKLKPDSPLSLALINVKTIGTMTGIRPFDLQKELAESSGFNLIDWLTIAGQQRGPESPEPQGAPARPEPAKPAKRPAR